MKTSALEDPATRSRHSTRKALVIGDFLLCGDEPGFAAGPKTWQ